MRYLNRRPKGLANLIMPSPADIYIDRVRALADSITVCQDILRGFGANSPEKIRRSIGVARQGYTNNMWDLAIAIVIAREGVKHGPL